jgi:transcriptional regulator with XRE-family HTH domain
MSAMIEYDRYAVGRVVRQLRKERGRSQEVLSGLAGMARSHLAMVENGDKQANFETLWRIANALDIKPHELVRRIEEEIEQ